MNENEATELRRASMPVRTFNTFEEMDEADAEFYESLTPQQRLDMMVELISNVIGTHPASRRDDLYPVIRGNETLSLQKAEVAVGRSKGSWPLPPIQI